MEGPGIDYGMGKAGKCIMDSLSRRMADQHSAKIANAINPDTYTISGLRLTLRDGYGIEHTVWFSSNTELRRFVAELINAVEL